MLLLPAIAGAAPQWRELTSEHFVVRTELSKADGETLIQTLEESRAAMLTMVWGGGPGPAARTSVIALGSEREMSGLISSIGPSLPPFRMRGRCPFRPQTS